MQVRLVLPIACATLLSAVQSRAQVTPPQAVGYEVAGNIVDASRRGLAEVEVAMIRDAVVVHTVISADNGRFSFGKIAPGPVSLHFRRLGFAPLMMDVNVGPGLGAAVREVRLVEAPSQLEDILISTDSDNTRYPGFNERKQQRKSFARFLEQKDIRRLGPTNASDLFRSVPGITIRAASPGNTIRVRGCQPMVWVNGQRVPGAELDEVTQPSEIGAIEFYPSFAGIPAQFLERGNRLCGLILVWTR